MAANESDNERGIASVASQLARRVSGGLTLASRTFLISTVTLSGVAAAQAADEAGSAMCESGAGPLITFVIGFMIVGLVLTSVFRGTMAWNNLGSARQDKKRQGKEQAIGAGITLIGAFFPAMMGIGLDRAGIDTISCIDFGNILVIVPNLPMFF